MTTRRHLLTRARLYGSIRSAHLERAHEFAPATILYSVKRYDFKASLTDGLSLIHAPGLKAARLLVTSKVRELEVNEPLMLPSLPSTTLALLALTVRDIAQRRRSLVVTYAIGNTDPFAQAIRSRLRSKIRRFSERVLAHLVWRRIDRVAFGTESAQAVYSSVLPASRRRQQRLIPALPSACRCAALPQAEEPAALTDRVIFLGALVQRKGFPTLVEAWPDLVAALPDAQLVILGKGKLADRARDLAAAHPSVTFIEDPERDLIHIELRRARVAVLASRSSPTWREQVGLPIVEALSHGCKIVTTTETGLASWLSDRTHTVIDPDYDAESLTHALQSALQEPRPSSREVLDSLPATDGRLEADKWLFSDRE